MVVSRWWLHGGGLAAMAALCLLYVVSSQRGKTLFKMGRGERNSLSLSEALDDSTLHDEGVGRIR
eukprot:759246-Hanusia_phi.AAC.2